MAGELAAAGRLCEGLSPPGPSRTADPRAGRGGQPRPRAGGAFCLLACPPTAQDEEGS